MYEDSTKHVEVVELIVRVSVACSWSPCSCIGFLSSRSPLSWSDTISLICTLFYRLFALTRSSFENHLQKENVLLGLVFAQVPKFYASTKQFFPFFFPDGGLKKKEKEKGAPPHTTALVLILPGIFFLELFCREVIARISPTRCATRQIFRSARG